MRPANHRREHAREPGGHAVAAADRFKTEFAVSRAHRADETHAARHAVELGGDEAALGQDQVGSHDARDLALKAILAPQPHDEAGLALVEVVGHEGRGRAASAALIEARKGTVEDQEVGSEPLDRR
jgi:hypothetical protein